MSEVETAVDRGDELEPVVVEEAAPEPLTEEEQLELPGIEPAAEEEVEEEGEEEDPKAVLIPKNRFDEAVGRERAEKERLASQLAAIEKREADRAVAADMQKSSAQIKELVKEHTKLLADGELDQASSVMEQMLQLQSDMADYRSRAYADQGRSQAKSEIQYDAVVAKLEMDYPEINPDNVEAFDRDAVRKVQAYMTGLMQMDNMTASKALQEAVSTILGAQRAEENQTDDDKRREAAELGVRRKGAAVSKAIDAKNRQPASLKDVGKDHDKQGGTLSAAMVMKMTQDEFMKLPDADLPAMRGDFI